MSSFTIWLQINLTVNLEKFKKLQGSYEMALVACENSHLSLPATGDVSLRGGCPSWKMAVWQAWAFAMLYISKNHYSKKKFDPQRSNTLICEVLTKLHI